MNSLSILYDKKFLFRCLFWFAVVFGLMQATHGVGFAIVIPMAFYAALTRKSEHLLFWLMVAVCSLIVNPHLVAKGNAFAWMQRGLMLALGCLMAINVLTHPINKVLRPYAGMFFYIFYMVFSSAQGWCPVISFLKLILFSFVYFAYLGVANEAGFRSRDTVRRLRSMMLSVAIVFILGSMILVPFPELSQLKADDIAAGIDISSYTSLFMGMTNHSQCLGPIVSSISVVLFGDLLFSMKKVDPLYVLILLCCPYLIYLSSSRTGMGAYLLGMMFVVYIFFSKARGINSRWKARVFSSLMLVIGLCLLVVLCLPNLQSRVGEFLLKTRSYDSAELSTASIFKSRQGLMDRALYNFRKSPLIGNGFQVSDEMAGLKIKDGVHILSAPIEKGVWVTAVLEEGGIIGWAIFVVFLIVCIVKSITNRAYIGASSLFLCMLTNLGEFTFFSMSYSGGFTWIMVFLGLAMDIQRLREEENRMAYYRMVQTNVWMREN